MAQMDSAIADWWRVVRDDYLANLTVKLYRIRSNPFAEMKWNAVVRSPTASASKRSRLRLWNMNQRAPRLPPGPYYSLHNSDTKTSPSFYRMVLQHCFTTPHGSDGDPGFGVFDMPKCSFGFNLCIIK